MRISIYAKNLEVSNYLRGLVEKKVGKLERYFSPDTEVQVTLSQEKTRHIVEVTIPCGGSIVRAEEVTGDMYASIDNVLDKLEKQLVRNKTKIKKSHKAETFTFVDVPDEVPMDEEESGPQIVRRKKFNIKPMDEEEAVLQADLLGHSFYVFMNSETNELNVLYRRKDGNFGLIEPEN